jgi:hypothetical protein
MKDRELLELAAKAAGYDMQHSISAVYPYPDQFHVNNKQWNPLADDGDALRLAVKLRLCMDTDYNNGAAAGGPQFSMAEFWEPYATDPCAATRRAIVRAAAEIGKGLT